MEKLFRILNLNHSAIFSNTKILLSVLESLTTPLSHEKQVSRSPVKKSRRIPTSLDTPRGRTSSKNIMKNYSRALVNFASSSVAKSYLFPVVKRHDISLQELQNYFAKRKEQIHCINRLRELLLVKSEDTRQMAAIKTVFREISIVFLKFFSVNWVFSSKVCDKISHLNFRQKILRRVQNPVYFTYLQEFAKKEVEKKSVQRRFGLTR